MSGLLTNISGFQLPTTLAGFAATLQTATFRGVPFKVVSQQITIGRKIANHVYPFRDGGWPEDLGRAQRIFHFTGYLIGDIAPAMQVLLQRVLEMSGSGLLIHPTVGAVQASVRSATMAVHKERMRVISIDLQFLEDDGLPFPLQILGAAIQVAAAVTRALAAMNTDVQSSAGPVADTPDARAEAQAVTGAFGSQVIAAAQDPTAVLGMATALPNPTIFMTYGRYRDGSATTLLPDGTTIPDLEAQAAQTRSDTEAGVAALTASAGTYVAGDPIMQAISAPVETMRNGINNPADQVRVLLPLTAFSFTDDWVAYPGLGDQVTQMREIMVKACKWAACCSLGLAATDYRPVSYDDAYSLRETIQAAFDPVITEAGDDGYDVAYEKLTFLKQLVVLDLTRRGGALPQTVTVDYNVNLPSLAIAQMRYRDASRSEEIAGEAQAIHPAFCPTTFKVLSR